MGGVGRGGGEGFELDEAGGAVAEQRIGHHFAEVRQEPVGLVGAEFGEIEP